jgi:hypothetical protein
MMTVSAQGLDEQLLRQVLKPYRDDCRYLKSAQLIGETGEVAARGRFEMTESCYIDDTGHFNAVEFNICYNQLGYYLIAKCVEDGLFPAFAAWTMADFWERQLSDVLIHTFSSRFRRMIDSRSFEGDVVFREPVISRRPGRPDVMFMETVCSFRDDGGGSAEGEVNLAFTRLP